MPEEIVLDPNLFIYSTKSKTHPPRLIRCRILYDCWIVISHKPNDHGYICLTRYIDGVSIKKRLQRLVYEYYHGPIPKGLCVRHKCDNRACINPDHLQLGTQLENVRDRVKRKRTWSKLTEQQVREIKADKHSSHRQLARKYDISKAQIIRIRQGKRWKGV